MQKHTYMWISKHQFPIQERWACVCYTRTHTHTYIGLNMYMELLKKKERRKSAHTQRTCRPHIIIPFMKGKDRHVSMCIMSKHTFSEHIYACQCIKMLLKTAELCCSQIGIITVFFFFALSLSLTHKHTKNKPTHT